LDRCAGASSRPRPGSQSSRRSTHAPRRWLPHRCSGTPFDAIASSWLMVSTSGEERRSQEDAVFHPTQVGRSLRVRWHLVHAAWQEGISPGHVRYRNVPTERAHGEDPRPHAGDLTSGCAWIGGSTPQRMRLSFAAARPLPAEDLEAYEVSTLVNSPRNDSSECVRPVKAGWF
jgi:hypothetical protein